MTRQIDTADLEIRNASESPTARGSALVTEDSRPTYLGSIIEKIAPALLAVLIAYSFIRNILAAAARPFWYDEICTWAMVKQPSVSALLSALRHAADGQPPAYYLVERAAAMLLRNEEIAFRLPSIIAFCFVPLCLFIFVRRRIGNTYALICALIPFATILYSLYAFEARPYMLVAACISIALVCYQRADRLPWALMMGLALAFSQTLHYLSILAALAFFAAEAVYSLHSRRLRWGVWFSLTCGGLLPFVLVWPFLARFKAVMGSNYWAKPSLYDALTSFGYFLNVPAAWGLGLATAALVLIISALRSEPASATTRSSQRPLVEIHETFLILMLLALPFIGEAVAKIAHGGMTSRYALPAVLAFPLAASYLLPRLGRKNAGLLAIFLVIVVAYSESDFWRTHSFSIRPVASSAGSIKKMANSAGYPDLPIVVSNTNDYLPIAHYAQPSERASFFFIADLANAIAYVKSDSDDRQLLTLSSYMPLQVSDFPSFQLEHPRFLLYSGYNALDWWSLWLVRQGYSLRLIAAARSQKIYLVEKSSS